MANTQKNNKQTGGVPTQDVNMENKGVAIKESQKPVQTAAQAGQAANTQMATEQETALPTLDTLKQQEQKAINKISQLTEQGTATAEIIKRGLQAKQQAMPYDEKIAKAKRRIGRISLSDYEGIPIQEALRLMNNDIADINSRAGYFQTKKEEAEAEANTVVADVQNLLNQQLQGLGLQVTSIGQQKQDLYTEQAAAEQQRQFNEQMALQRAQLAAASGGGGGGGTGEGTSESALAWADLIARGEATLDNVPSKERAGVASILSSQGIGAPEKIGSIPTFEQYYQQQQAGSSSSLDPNKLVPQYQEYRRGLESQKNNSLLGFFSALAGGQSTPVTGQSTSSAAQPAVNPMSPNINLDDEDF
jgi:hypothetical protein